MNQKRRRIIAVDDNEDTLEIIRLSLEKDYDVMTISNPVELFDELELFEPDLLILDVMMPRVTGFQIIQMLQKHPGTKDIPVVLLSAKNTPGDIKHGYKLGASLYLTKPFEPERLLKNVRTQLDSHGQANEKRHPISEVVSKLKMKPAFLKGFVKVVAQLDSEEETRELELKKRFQNRGKTAGRE